MELVGKSPPASEKTKRCGLDHWVGKIPLEKGMTTHFSNLTWRIPWTEDPGGLQSKGCKESDMTEVI